MDSSINAVSISLCQFEAWCNLQVLKAVLKQNSRQTYKPIYGCENGFSSFISLSVILDASVYIYEALKFYNMHSPKDTITMEQIEEYSDLKVVRNNIHSFYKQGGYKNKANTIISKKLSEFKMDKPDILYVVK